MIFNSPILFAFDKSCVAITQSVIFNVLLVSSMVGLLSFFVILLVYLSRNLMILAFFPVSFPEA